MSDNKEVITCPACGNYMQKIFMPEASVNIDICLEGCGGILFDNREFQKFDEPHEKIDEILDAIKDKTFIKVDESETRTCPLCNVPMVKMGAGSAGVQIDVCNVCGAKFLDNGELQKIRTAGEAGEETDRLDSLMNSLYADNLKDVLGNRQVPSKTSSRRKFFEDLVYKLITK